MMADGVRAALIELVRSAHDLRRQRTIYHYTTSRGLEGILSSGVLRASNYRHLNDASEVGYGCELVADVLAREAKRRSQTFHNAIIDIEQSLRSRWDQYLDRQLMDIYVTSFCEAADRLSQWRAYGKPEGSYCIGFEIRRLDGIGLFWPRRVIYEPEEQRSEIETTIGRLNELSAPMTRADDVEFLLRYAMVELACRLKHPAFREEGEWRSIIDASNYDSQELIRFPSPDSGPARPFVELIRGSVDSRLLPISEIIVGPCRDQPASVATAQELLDRFGYRNANLSVSRIPLVF